MKWIVIGGCGFLGSALSRRLLADGCDVAIYDNLCGPGSHARHADLRAHVTVGNTGDFHRLHAFIQSHADADALAFVSGQVSMLTSLEDPRRDMESNFLGAFNCLEAMRRVKFGGVAIMASTNKVYGDGRLAVAGRSRYFAEPVGEHAPLDFRTPYGCSKGAADQYWRDYHRTYGLRTIVLRHSSMYGPGQIGEVGHGWVAWFLQEARKRSPVLHISGDGKQVRDLLHIDDAAEAYVLAAMRGSACAGEAYNVGGGPDNSLSIVELLEWLDRTLPERWVPQIERGPWRLSDQRCFVADNSAFTAATGWRPKIAVRDGLARLLDG